MIKAIFFDTDDDGHWYAVDAERRAEWQAWRNLPQPKGFDAYEWEVYETPPEFAERIDGHPNQINVVRI